MLLPLLKEHAGFRLAAACARSGLTVRAAVENDGFAKGTTDYRELIADPSVDVVYVATRHDLHYPDREGRGRGRQGRVRREADDDDGRRRPRAGRGRRTRGTLLTVGFNRRFSPHAARLKELLRPIAAPKTLLYRVNAGALPPEHWLLDPVEGGGRLLGEGVHFFDMLRFLAGAEPVRVRSVSPPGKAPRRGGGRDRVRATARSARSSTRAAARRGSARSASRCSRAARASCSTTTGASRSTASTKEGVKTRTIEKGQKEQLENFHRALRGEAPLGVTAEDGLQATWCAETAVAASAQS